MIIVHLIEAYDGYIDILVETKDWKTLGKQRVGVGVMAFHTMCMEIAQ